MQLNYNQLNAHLQKTLLPVYLISGDVPLLVQETKDLLRQAATKAGFVQRERLTVERSFKWSILQELSCSLSLFGDKTLIELDNPDARFEAPANDALLDYCNDPPPDKLLMIITNKLTPAQLKTSWCQAIDKLGCTIRLWPIKPQELPGWLEARAQAAGLDLSPSGLSLLIELTEGNLLASQQAIDKLRLLFPGRTIDSFEVAAATGNNSQYNVFDLSQPLLEGKATAVLRILTGLREEACEPVLVLWLLARELRMLLNAGGKAPTWSPSQAAQQIALKRISSTLLKQWLCDAAYIDQIIKGCRQGDAWVALTQLALRIAGKDILASYPGNTHPQPRLLLN